MGLGLALSLTTAGPAFADVGVTPSSEPAGGSGELTFRVTDDIPDAGTTSFELDLPADHPLLGVVPAAKFGWGLAIERSPVPGPTAGRVTRIIWSAHSTTTAIQPGRYGTFSISVREFPIDAARVRISALQTWSNGEVVQWIDARVPGGPAPLHPAPEITLTAGGSTSGLGDRVDRADRGRDRLADADAFRPPWPPPPPCPSRCLTGPGRAVGWSTPRSACPSGRSGSRSSRSRWPVPHWPGSEPSAARGYRPDAVSVANR